MIRKVQVKNYKSVLDLELDLGRLTVLIGANGSGKSNILEAIALASAASQSKLDNEFLISRGVRVTANHFMLSAFDKKDNSENEDVAFSKNSRKKSVDGIAISAFGEDGVEYDCKLHPDETSSYPKWKWRPSLGFAEYIATAKDVNLPQITFDSLDNWLKEKAGALPGFLIYAPENSALRTFQAEGQILPLGIRGEGLFAHLKALNSDAHRDRLVKIKEQLMLIDWFAGFDIPENLSPGERSIRIRDRFLPDGALFDQRSANEGFLFLLFYLTLFISPETPAFFSIDNVDASLNPKLCVALMQQLAKLAREHDKQVIFTTHNPAVLDGLDLHDDEQRLLVVDRNLSGHTQVRRVEPPKPIEGRPPVSLSHAFLRGYIGGLPDNF